jgi:hypothetical protein
MTTKTEIKTPNRTGAGKRKSKSEQHCEVAAADGDDELQVRAQLRLATLRWDRERLRQLLAANYSRWRDDILRADNLGLVIADHIGLIDLVMTADWLLELQMSDLRPVAGRYVKREE